ncbi:MAG: hypothetical protein R8K20_05955 [Gallionellaceae bacterium]
MKKSDQLLLAIYILRPRINDNLELDVGTLAWIIYNGFKDWVDGNGPKSIMYNEDKENELSYMHRPLRDRNTIIKELSILSAKGCVEFTPPSGFDFMFKVCLLPNGIIRADQLSTPFGKANLWFVENKNGILGVIFVALISVSVSFVTTMLTAPVK